MVGMRIALAGWLAVPLWLAAQEPRLLLNLEDIARMKASAAREPWAARARDAVLRSADEWPEAHVRTFGLKEWGLPPEGGGWSHAYVCPEHGTRLRQDAGRNLCPVDGKDFHGWPYDHVAYSQRHGDNARAVRDLGLAYRLTGKSVYAEKARGILRVYAEIYPTLPIHGNKGERDNLSGARVMSQTLSESSWLLPLAFGYDLVREAAPAGERRRFETDVLRNAAAVIARRRRGPGNWDSWQNAAQMAVGLLTDDPAMVDKALDKEFGFRAQMVRSITPDGPWYEGAWGYHFYALNPLLMTLEMATRAGIRMPEAAALKRMLDAPLMSVFPDGTLPNFNDSGLTRLAGMAHYYDIGFRLFGDRRYLGVARGAERGLEAWLWGAASIAEGEAPPLGSAVLPEAGVATLRAAGSDSTVAVKFGPHGGGHGHYDKLTFNSFAGGAQQAADPGTQAYAFKTHATWDKTTVAHNTVVVDEHTQAGATGKLLEWRPGEATTTIRVSAGPVYPGVELERLMVHTAGYTLDVFEARATDGKTHRFDWVYHNYGEVSSPLRVSAYSAFPAAEGYQHLSSARGTETAAAWEAVFTQRASRMRVRMLGEPGTTVVLGNGLGPDLQVPVPFVMARRKGTSARFVALYEPGAATPLSLRLDGADTVVVGTERIRIAR